MKQILFSLLLWAAFGLGLSAQNISVTSFRFDEYDLTANLAGTSVEDQNGNKCALIRIQTTEKGFSFDVGVLGVQKVDDNKVGEVWVYVPAGVRKMTIRHQQLGTLSKYVFPVNIVGSKTYVMELATAQKLPIEDGRPVVISAPAGADIYVDGRRVATGRFEGSLSYGSHTAYAARDGKQTEAQTIDVPMGSGALPGVTLAFFGPQTFRVNGVSFVMMPVEAGTFTMGATSEMENPWNDEKPTHRVTLTRGYYLGRTEVTQALWRAVMGKNPSHFKGDERPVENVSWKDCQKFLRKLNKLTGRTFRLPTEAEWEYAARGGRKGRGCPYSGSRSIEEVAWYYGNSNNQTHDVGTKQPNELGLYDMTGNVWEWCNDWSRSYDSAAQTDPTGPSSGSYRVSRGGSWYNNARFCRSSYRYGSTPGSRRNRLGLRLCLSE